MELTVVMCGIICGISVLCSVAGLALSIWNTIHIQAQKLSTHTVIPVSPETTMSSLESELERIVKDAGGIQSDLNRNLHRTGLDPEDLV